MLYLAQQSATESVGKVGPILFYALAALVALSAWAIVLSQNIVRMAVYLLLTLAGAAGVYFMLNAELLAAIQLIVYAGGTLILIVFGVMLTSRNPFLQLRAKRWEIVLGVGLGVILAGLLLLALVNTKLNPEHLPNGPAIANYNRVETLGKALISDYVLPFEVAAVLLLVVMIGAAYMARGRAK